MTPEPLWLLYTYIPCIKTIFFDKDKRNFVVDPPEGTEFVFDMRESLAQALVCNLNVAFFCYIPNLQITGLIKSWPKTRINALRLGTEKVSTRTFFFRFFLNGIFQGSKNLYFGETIFTASLFFAKLHWYSERLSLFSLWRRRRRRWRTPSTSQHHHRLRLLWSWAYHAHKTCENLV